MGRKAKVKSEYADLDAEFKNSVESMPDEEIKKRLAEIALDEHENQKNKKEDQDLKEKKEAAKMAGEQYSEATKTNRMKIAYCSMVLEARGKR